MLRKHRGAHDRGHADDSLDETRRHFGGFDLPAAAAGALAATGATALLGTITAAVIAVRHDQGADSDRLWAAGAITAAAVLVVALLVGGWVAGRMARYDGLRNGWLCGLLFALLLGAATGAGNWADDRWQLLQDVQAPGWASSPSTGAEIATALVSIAAVLVVAGLAGAIGARYHHRADSLLVTAAPAIVKGDADLVLAQSDQEQDDQVGRKAVR